MVSSRIVRPDEALLESTPPPFLASCEHFAGSARFIEKALRIRKESAFHFDITCDCEDGATVGQEAAQLEMIVDTLTSTEFVDEPVGVRVHETTHPRFEVEIARVIGSLDRRLRYLTIPKIEDLADAERAVRQVRAAAAALDAVPPPLHLLIETHGGLRDVRQISALNGVDTLDFGLMDFVSAHRGALGRECMRSPAQFTHPLIVRAKAEIVAAATAAGKTASHNVTIEVTDPEQAFLDARQARHSFGFMRMWSVHPSQIQPIVRGMSIEESELAFAVDVLLRAQRAQWGPIRVGSELFDRASYRYLWDLVRRAVNQGQIIDDEAKSAFFK